MIRRYTVTNDEHPNGAEFMHNGRLYRRSIIGSAIFDHDISPERTAEAVNEFKAAAKMSTSEYNEKYGV